MRAAQRDIFGLLAAGRIVVPDPRAVTLHEVPAALDQLAGGATHGKTVMLIP